MLLNGIVAALQFLQYVVKKSPLNASKNQGTKLFKVYGSRLRFDVKITHYIRRFGVNFDFLDAQDSKFSIFDKIT